jgi:DNA-binding transcriptional regulator YiaG
MGKVESIIKSEIIRLAKGEMRKISIPLGRDVRLMKNTVSQVRKSVLALERFAAHQQKELSKREIRLEATPEEVKKSRLSPRLIKSLRKHLGITQKELAILTGVTIGAAHQWEIGKFNPKPEKKAAIVALRKLGRGEVKKLLEEKASGKAKGEK